MSDARDALRGVHHKPDWGKLSRCESSSATRWRVTFYKSWHGNLYQVTFFQRLEIHSIRLQSCCSTIPRTVRVIGFFTSKRWLKQSKLMTFSLWKRVCLMFENNRKRWELHQMIPHILIWTDWTMTGPSGEIDEVDELGRSFPSNLKHQCINQSDFFRKHTHVSMSICPAFLWLVCHFYTDLKVDSILLARKERWWLAKVFGRTQKPKRRNWKKSSTQYQPRPLKSTFFAVWLWLRKIARVWLGLIFSERKS